MRSLFIFILLSASLSFAQESLKDPMKLIGEQFKIIALAVQAQAVTQVELEAAESLQITIDEAALIFPETAVTEEKRNFYTDLMDQLSQKSQDLRDTIELQVGNNPQDLTEIIQFFGEMNQLRRQGHQEFKID